MNEKQKPTPGPWGVCDGDDCGDPNCTGIYKDFPNEDGSTFGQGVLHSDEDGRITPEQARANAVLAAAAPDLLAQLQHLRDMVQLAIDRDVIRPTEYYAESMLIAEALDLADAAIRRAEGGDEQ